MRLPVAFDLPEHLATLTDKSVHGLRFTGLEARNNDIILDITIGLSLNLSACTQCHQHT